MPKTKDLRPKINVNCRKRVKDNLTLVFAEIGNLLIEAFDIKGILGNVTQLVQYFKNTVLPIIKNVTSSVGRLFKIINQLVTNPDLLFSFFKNLPKQLWMSFKQVLKNVGSFLLEVFKVAAIAFGRILKTELDFAIKNFKRVPGTRNVSQLFQKHKSKRILDETFKLPKFDLFKDVGFTPEIKKILDELKLRRREKKAEGTGIVGKLTGFDAPAPVLTTAKNRSTVEGALRNSAAFFTRIAELRRSRQDRQLKKLEEIGNTLTEIKKNTSGKKTFTGFDL